jgi:hypothetical protein
MTENEEAQAYITYCIAYAISRAKQPLTIERSMSQAEAMATAFGVRDGTDQDGGMSTKADLLNDIAGDLGMGDDKPA